MSVDFDQLYERLAERADAARLPGLDGIRARARRRGRNRTIVTAAAVAVGMVAALVPWLARGGTAPPVLRPDMPPPMTFIPFDPSAKPAIAFDRPPGRVVTITDDTRAYASWTGTDGTQNVAAIDVVTGRPLFTPVNLGRLGDYNSMQVARDAIVMTTDLGSQDLPDTIIALDPGTGRELWRRSGFRGSDRVLYAGTLVAAWHDERRIEAIDLRTGAVRWIQGEPTMPGGTIAVQPREGLYSMYNPGYSIPEDYPLAVRTLEGRLKVLDVATGRVLSERDAPLPPNVSFEMVVDGKLYILSDNRHLDEVDLSGTAPPRRVYTGTVNMVVPCGDRLLCVAGEGVTAIDPVTTGVVWHNRTGKNVVPSPSGVLVAVEGGMVLLDPSGEARFERELRAAVGTWIDAGNLFVMRDLRFSGLALSTGKVTDLRTPAVLGDASWNREVFVCPTDSGIFVWRYAR